MSKYGGVAAAAFYKIIRAYILLYIGTSRPQTIRMTSVFYIIIILIYTAHRVNHRWQNNSVEYACTKTPPDEIDRNAFIIVHLPT